MDNYLIKQSIDEWRESYMRARTTLLKRSLPVPLPSLSVARALIGVRRCGKTMSAIEASLDWDADVVFYYNFEDPLFFGSQSPQHLDSLLGVAQEYAERPFELLILDEIQVVVGWELWVRKLIDQKRYRIIITGSSATLLSSELASSLTGRAIETKIWPLSYAEFLSFTDKKPHDAFSHRQAFRLYMEWGGFPQVALEADHQIKRELATQYLSDILFKDVVQRHEIRDAQTLSRLTTYLFTNISSLHSHTGIRKAFGISTDLSSHYLNALVSAFLFFEVERYHKNLKIQARDSRKIYGIDVGLRNVAARSPEPDTGKILENIVYLELRRRGHTVMYFKEKQEVDFVVVEGYRPAEAIQVCADGLDAPSTRKRELTAIQEAMTTLGLERGTIVSLTHEERIRLENGGIVDIVPAYEWLL